jgi:hypothetical protein
MNREIRRVPTGWVHPSTSDPAVVPSVVNQTARQIAIDNLRLKAWRERGNKEDPPATDVITLAHNIRQQRLELGLHDGEAFIPLRGQTLSEARSEWDYQRELWVNGKAEGQTYGDLRTEAAFIGLNGPRPIDNPHVWWPEFEDADAYQVYETVSEGTPVSPVFDTLQAAIAWMAQETKESQ